VSETLRIDKWLWFARICKTRSLAQAIIERGDVYINGQKAEKPNRPIKLGDQISVDLGAVERTVTVLVLPHRRGPAPEAAASYEEPQPPQRKNSRNPSPLQRIPGSGRPTKRERRALEAFFIRSREED